MNSSTARAEAIGASPGRVTVHCWSRVRLAVDCMGSIRVIIELDRCKTSVTRHFFILNSGYYISWSNHIIAEVTAQSLPSISII